MTKYRWKPEQTTRDRIARNDMYRGKNADERDDNARRDRRHPHVDTGFCRSHRPV